jgi:hypothetical protein
LMATVFVLRFDARCWGWSIFHAFASIVSNFENIQKLNPTVL